MALIKFKNVADNMAFEREEEDGLARYVKRAPKDGGYNAENIATRNKVTFADDDEVIDSPVKKLYIAEDGVEQPTLCTDYNYFVLTAGKRRDPHCDFEEDFRAVGWIDVILKIMDKSCCGLVQKEIGPAWPNMPEFEALKSITIEEMEKEGVDGPVACHYDAFLPRYLEIAPCDLILPPDSQIEKIEYWY